MKKIIFPLSFICLNLFSINIYAQTNFLHVKDSVDIGNFSNCNNFIVHKENITVEGCPIGKGNSYIGEKGFGTYLGKFVGLDKKINLDNDNYQQQKIGGNTRYFSTISTTPVCYFKGRQFAHYDESTTEIHKLIKPRVSEIVYQNCHNNCDKYANLLGKIGEREETHNCPNIPSLKYTKKIKTTIEYPDNLSANKLALDKVTNKWHFKPQHCDALRLKEEEIANDSSLKCTPPLMVSPANSVIKKIKCGENISSGRYSLKPIIFEMDIEPNKEVMFYFTPYTITDRLLIAFDNVLMKDTGYVSGRNLSYAFKNNNKKNAYFTIYADHSGTAWNIRTYCK